MRNVCPRCREPTINSTAATPQARDSGHARGPTGPTSFWPTATSTDAIIDFGVPGVLRVVARGDSEEDRAAVGRDIGRSDIGRADTGGADTGGTGPAGDRFPDVAIRFVDQLSPSGLRVLDGGCAGYGDGGVYFLDPSTHAPLARVSLGARWGEARIVCRRGLRRVPFLSTALDLSALFHHWAPVHASGWVSPAGTGVLVAGWAHSGKTGALLSACERGASPVGDDRILLSPSGARMVGLGRPLDVKDWHMAQLRLGALGRRPVRRTLAEVASAVDAGFRRVSDGTSPGPVSRLASRALHRLRRGLSLEVPAEQFSPVAQGARIDVVILLETHRYASIVAERVTPASGARRLAAQTEGELLPALREHLAFRYAQADGGWADVGRAPARARSILAEATLGLPTYLVRHPYPCPLQELDAVITGVVEEL